MNKGTDCPKYAVFVISYGRPDNCKTYEILKDSGAEFENLYIVCSDDDSTLPQYQERYGDRVLVFNKEKCLNEMGFDMCVNFPRWGCSIFARNKCYEFAEQLGYEYFAVIDDDMECPVQLRWAEGGQLKSLGVRRNCDKVFSAFARFMDSAHLDISGLPSSYFFVGGVKIFTTGKGYSTEPLNCFWMRTANKKKIPFINTYADDLSGFNVANERGALTVCPAYVQCFFTVDGSNSGGIDRELDGYSWTQLFSVVVTNPNRTKMTVTDSGIGYIRKRDFPRILDEKWKK